MQRVRWLPACRSSTTLAICGTKPVPEPCLATTTASRYRDGQLFDMHQFLILWNRLVMSQEGLKMLLNGFANISLGLSRATLHSYLQPEPGFHGTLELQDMMAVGKWWNGRW